MKVKGIEACKWVVNISTTSGPYSLPATHPIQVLPLLSEETTTCFLEEKEYEEMCRQLDEQSWIYW
jgi:hypothetical protein